MADLANAETIAAGLAFLTAGMNVYSFIGTSEQINSLIKTVNSQSSASASQFNRVSDALSRAQDQADELTDALVKALKKATK